MKLCLIGQNFRYELEKLIRIFMPFEKIEFFDTKQEGESLAVTEIYTDDGKEYAKATLVFSGKTLSESKEIDLDTLNIQKERELKLALCLFECFTKLTGYKPDWGILTGVRPAKLYSRLLSNLGENKTDEYFKNNLCVSDGKISLCKETSLGEGEIISLSRPDSFSLYISVPFCPTRCTYCSFVSHSVEKADRLIPQYVKYLCEELKVTGKIARDLNLHLETVYIGGGTPTTLSAEQLTEILNCVKENFCLSSVREFTVEAGRPDTVTREKLLAIVNGGVTRISINPQTMNDSVLEEIGRKHTSNQTVEAFNLARKLGFGNINMDLIAGLPGDTFESFQNTLNRVLELGPESVTVHSLSVKRAADLNANGNLPQIERGITATHQVDYALGTLKANGINPYYMYRQSKTVGNLENVGYAKKGYECLYNVYIMDETHTILACGASAVTKMRQANGNLIERIFNFKYPYEYINRFDEILLRKDGVYKFYQKSITEE